MGNKQDPDHLAERVSVMERALRRIVTAVELGVLGLVIYVLYKISTTPPWLLMLKGIFS